MPTRLPLNSLLTLSVAAALVFTACVPAASAQPVAFPTSTPVSPTTTPVPAPTATTLPLGYRVYVSKSGDTLAAVAARAGALPFEITSRASLPAQGLIAPGTEMFVPDRLGQTISGENLDRKSVV